jgi:acylphosphatase
VRITGVVQGVGFRWFVRERARRLGLAGWVRNLPDGSVEAIAEGSPGNLAAFLLEIHRGPAFSRVTSVDEQEYPLTGRFKSFEVIY